MGSTRGCEDGTVLPARAAVLAAKRWLGPVSCAQVPDPHQQRGWVLGEHRGCGTHGPSCGRRSPGAGAAGRGHTGTILQAEHRARESVLSLRAGLVGSQDHPALTSASAGGIVDVEVYNVLLRCYPCRRFKSPLFMMLSRGTEILTTGEWKRPCHINVKKPELIFDELRVWRGVPLWFGFVLILPANLQEVM